MKILISEDKTADFNRLFPEAAEFFYLKKKRPQFGLRATNSEKTMPCRLSDPPPLGVDYYGVGGRGAGGVNGRLHSFASEEKRKVGGKKKFAFVQDEEFQQQSGGSAPREGGG